MDLKILHYKCQNVVRTAFDHFKHSIVNAVFKVDTLLVNIELAVMKQSIITKMNTWFMDCNFSEKQYIYMKGVIKYYEDIAITTALKFSKKYC